MATRHEVRWLFHSTAMVNDYVAARDWLRRFAGARALHDSELYDPASLAVAG